jgi:hypothetical protein
MIFAESNISPETGTELVQALGLDAFELQKPDVLARYLEIARYLATFTDGPHVARTVARKEIKSDRLMKVWEYVSLRRSLDEVRKAKSELPKNDMISDEAPEILLKRQEIESREQSLVTELQRYEQ